MSCVRILQLFNIPPGTGAGRSWRIPSRVIDEISTSLPTGTNVIIDGVSLQDGDDVLFTNLTNPAENDRVYRLSGVGISIIWTLRKDGQNTPPTGAPTDGDTMYVQEGTKFAEEIFSYDGTRWFRRSSSLLEEDLHFSPDCTHDIGTPTDLRPGNIYTCHSLNVGTPIIGDNLYRISRITSIQTTDDTPLNIFSYPLVDDSVYDFEASIIARTNDGLEFATIKNVASFEKTMTQSGILIGPGEQTLFETDTVWEADWVISGGGTQATLQVRGENSKTINWCVIIRMHEAQFSA